MNINEIIDFMKYKGYRLEKADQLIFNKLKGDKIKRVLHSNSYWMVDLEKAVIEIIEIADVIKVIYQSKEN